MTKKLLTTREAASFLGVSEAFLERDRWAGARIPFVRVGTRSVRYQESELDRYVEVRTRRSTSESPNDMKTPGALRLKEPTI